ncbi:hypothetical protein LTR17_007048 [Elasticomyces elasticus]|nr:hypothetical protein LTR17_007048 [Elasticomyces elasticus]
MNMTTVGMSYYTLLLNFFLLLTAHARDVLGQHISGYGIEAAVNVTSFVTGGPAFRAAVCKGEWQLKELAEGSQPQSIFTDRNALIDNGWTNDRSYAPPAPDGGPTQEGATYALPEDSIEVFKWLKLPYDFVSNRFYAYIQNAGTGKTKNDYGVGYPVDFQYGRTGAKFQNHIDPVTGMIVCEHNYGPGHEISKDGSLAPAPPLQRLSDVLWLQWADAVKSAGHTDFGSISNINYFYQHWIADEHSQAVIESVRGRKNQKLEEWPGKTYRMDAPGEEGDIAKALFGTHNGNAVAFFLGQHLAQLGRKKTVSQVTLWGDAGPKSKDYYRNLLVYVVDV